MALTLSDLKAHCNVVGTGDDAVLTRLLAAATAKIQADLGYALDDADELPDGAPDDLELAVLMTAADWFENREATISGTIIAPLPFGVPEIVANHRRYTFAAPCDDE